MKKSTKVTLLSALVFPGLGHFLLKKYIIAFAFILSFSYLLLGVISEVLDKTQQVMDSIIRGDISMDVSAIRQALIEQGVLESSDLSISTFLLLIIWVIAAFDAYRLAKKDPQDNID
ncbi:hypothetical protein [Colwellia psychrerythraea]|uniref:DUF5683 domain-containing protein n=1 Tax=Colwellia psychrerythraea TaxID=28229 RepID=A0A099KBK7_COLPS|nr:hypothetical protein [Colwellia psychrerythraea]KGJ87726.1 hypothetical protein GAB14E_4404 [Colwellia psychrerythraea]